MSEAQQFSNRIVVTEFFKALISTMLLSQYKLSVQEITFTADIFYDLHEIKNDPTTRDSKEPNIGPRAKAEYIQSKANEIIAARESRKGIKVELIEAVDPITGTNTFNTVVTLGNPMNGTTADIMVHHDTISAGDYSLSLENDKLVGRAIQDDTIHVAATLASLASLKVPKEGAIRLVFTDHEENGCRGSSALQKELLERTSPNHSYAVVALESTNQTLAYGHRGKFSGEAKSTTELSDPLTGFNTFYRQLVAVQLDTDANSGESTLGKNSGSSTYGYFKNGEFWAKLDFRTNTNATPDVVESSWNRALESTTEMLTEIDLTERAKKSLENNQYDIQIQGNEIQINSNVGGVHPSTFNPDNDTTVMPVLYLAVNALQQSELLNQGEVTEIEWGESNKLNSNPMVGKIEFSSELNFDKEELLNAISKLKTKEEFESSTKFQLRSSATVKSDSIETNLTDGFVMQTKKSLEGKLGQKISISTATLMTDAARIFNSAKRSGRKTYGFVWGVGNPANLHKVEELTIEDCLVAIKSMKVLPEIIIRRLEDPSA